MPSNNLKIKNVYCIHSSCMAIWAKQEKRLNIVVYDTCRFMEQNPIFYAL